MGTLTSHPTAVLGKQPWEQGDRVRPRGDHRERMKPWCPQSRAEQREGGTSPCVDGLMVAPAEEPLGILWGPWGHGLCFHTEEKVEKS